MLELSRDYWHSYNHHEGLINTAPNYRGFSVSVVLDEARDQYSAIRLLIVSEKGGLLDNVVIEGCPDVDRHHAPWFGALPLVKSEPIYRRRLVRRHDAHGLSQTVLDSHSHTLPVFTAVFQIIVIPDGFRGYGDCIALVPFPHLPTVPSFRVAYDCAYECDSSNPSLLAFLDSNERFKPLPPDRYFTYVPTGIPAHSIRVVPKTSRKPFKFQLPRYVVLLIVRFAVGDNPVGWRSGLLSYGLVCKAWTHVLDLFFDSIDESHNHDRAFARRVARSIEAKPERASRVRYFNADHFKPYLLSTDELPDGHSPDDWEDLLSILGHFKAAEIVRLIGVSIPKSLTDRLVQALSSLRHVHTFMLSMGNGIPGILTMSQIQSIASNWPETRELDLMDWAQESEQEIDSLPLHLPSKLKSIHLAHGVLSGPQLARFIPSSTPYIRRVTLIEVSGLTNRDLLLFLSSTCATLTWLSLHECPMSLSSEDEELALDALMPKMEVLEYLSVNGAHVSALAISRRSARRYKRHSDMMSNGMRAFSTMSIAIHSASPLLRLEDVREALAVSGWESVAIVWPEDTVLDQQLLSRTIDLARQREIIFTSQI